MSARTKVNISDFSVGVNTQDTFVLPATLPRNFLQLQNNGPSACAVSFDGNAATTNAKASIMLPVNGTPIKFQKGVPQNAIHARSVGTSALTVISDDANPTGNLLSGQPPFWILNPGNPPAYDLDFMHGRYWVNNKLLTDPRSFLTISRASSGTVNDISGNWATILSNITRISNNGLLCEESRVNSIRNNSMQGAVVGSPGTLPINWSIPGLAPLNSSVISTGVENGIDFVDIRINGTSGVGQHLNIQFETTTQIAASQNQTWTASSFVKLVGGSTSNITGIAQRLDEWTNVGAFINGSSASITPNSSALGTQRTPVTFTLPDATVAFVNNSIIMSFSNTAAIDITLRVGWPQLELGTWATSPIITTSAAATRAADVVSLMGPFSFGNSITHFAQGTPQAPAAYVTAQFINQIDDGTANNVSFIRKQQINGQCTVRVSSGGAVQYTDTATVWSISSKAAVAFTAGDQQGVFNGVLKTAGTGALLPSGLSNFRIGSDEAGIETFNGFIERIALWPTVRLNNATLQSITT